MVPGLLELGAAATGEPAVSISKASEGMSTRVRLQLVEGASAKFWELTVAGGQLTTTWGRIGTAGQSKTRTFASSERAALAGEKLLADKTGKGYRPATASAAKATRTTTRTPAKPRATAATAMLAGAEELGKLAAAIAGSSKLVGSPRFVLEWQPCTIRTYDGQLMVGEPLGARATIANQDGGPAAVFHLSDRAAPAGGTIVGVRLGASPAVSWRSQDPIAMKSGRYGVWSPGYGYSAQKRDGKTAGTKTSGEDTMHLVLAGKVRSIAAMVGLDSDGWPACYLFGDALRPDVFGARPGPADLCLAQDVRATADELRGLGVAIAARAKKPVSRRFRLEPMPGKVRTVGGELAYGDPGGKNALLVLRTREPVTLFRVVDLLRYGDGYGAWIYGARLGERPSVRWKLLRTIALTSDCFGFWSPGFPTQDITCQDIYTHGGLTAAIGDVHSTADDDRTCSVVLGLDAAGEPAALLLGNGLVPAVYVHRKPRT